MLVGKAQKGEVTREEVAEKLIKPACFTGNTLVITENGLVPIKDIKIGDKVYSKILSIDTDKKMT